MIIQQQAGHLSAQVVLTIKFEYIKYSRQLHMLLTAGTTECPTWEMFKLGTKRTAV